MHFPCRSVCVLNNEATTVIQVNKDAKSLRKSVK